MDAPYEIGSSSGEAYVYARNFTVPYTAQVALTVAAEVARLGHDVGASGCLVDIRGTEPVASVSDKADFAYHGTKLAALPQNWKYAFVRAGADPLTDFVGTFMRDAGFDFRVFEDELAAIKWLEGEAM
jgi:hypothetical protein